MCLEGILVVNYRGSFIIIVIVRVINSYCYNYLLV